MIADALRRNISPLIADEMDDAAIIIPEAEYSARRAEPRQL